MKIWLLEESHPLQVPVSGDNRPPDVCVIELGGTIGDIEGTLCVCVCVCVIEARGYHWRY